MENYFTKYLSIKGEVNQMDKYLDEGVVLTASLPSENYKGLQKVKLFLCSRDIQPGDKYYSSLTGKDILFTKYKEHLFGSVEHNFKIVGDVSAGSIWVKEKDEFNDGDFTIHIAHRSFPDLDLEFETLQEYNQYFTDHPNEKEKYGSRTVQIKCPTCKTFH